MRRRRITRGNTVIEAALVLPILVSLAFGTVEFGSYFYVKNILQGAAREGARAAIVTDARSADVKAAVERVLAPAGLGRSGCTVTTDPADISSAPAGQAITVSVQCNWGDAGSGLRPLGLIPADKPVTGTATMRRE